MNVITLRITLASPSILTMTMTSLDPERRISAPSYDTPDLSDVCSLLRQGSREICAALRSSDQAKLNMLGYRYGETLLPKALAEALVAGTERYLYLDLTEDVVAFPWELLLVSKSESLARRFFVGRHQRLQGQRPNHNAQILKRPVLLVDPSGNLPNAADEGTALKRQLSSAGIGSVMLASSITRNDALARIEEASLLHYSGHSTPEALILSDGPLQDSEIERCRNLPFFVFLNSCAPAAPEGWDLSASNLTKAFQRGGSHVVLCPVTVIDGREAAFFATVFYSKFLSGLTVGEAFYRAASEVDPSGLFGSRYVLYGNPLLKAHSPSQHMPEPYGAKKRPRALVIAKVIALFFVVGIMVLTVGRLLMNSPRLWPKAQVSSAEVIDPVPKDPRLALLWYKSAVTRPDAKPSHFRNLGTLLYAQAESIEDIKAALAAYNRAMELGDSTASLDERSLAAYLERESRIERLRGASEGPLAVEDFSAAKTLAARLSGPCPNPTYAGLPRSSPGSDLRIKEDACALFEPHIVDPQAGMVWYRKLALAGSENPGISGDPGALVELGRKFESGDGVPQNFQQAASWYQKAADAGDPYACSRLGHFYQHGLGVDKNLGESLEWRKRAVALSSHNPNLQQIYQSDLDEFLSRSADQIENQKRMK